MYNRNPLIRLILTAGLLLSQAGLRPGIAMADIGADGYDHSLGNDLLDSITVSPSEGFGQIGKTIVVSAATSLVSAGIGYGAGTVAKGLGGGALATISCQTAGGGLSGGINSAMQGGDFWDGAAAGAIGGGISGAVSSWAMPANWGSGARAAAGAGIGAVGGAVGGLVVEGLKDNGDMDRWWAYSLNGAITGASAGYAAGLKAEKSITTKERKAPELKGLSVTYTDGAGNRVGAQKITETNLKGETTEYKLTDQKEYRVTEYSSSDGTKTYFEGSPKYAGLNKVYKLDNPQYISETPQGMRVASYDQSTNTFTARKDLIYDSSGTLQNTQDYSGSSLISSVRAPQPGEHSGLKQFAIDALRAFNTRLIGETISETIARKVRLDTYDEKTGEWDKDKAEFYSTIAWGAVAGMVNPAASLDTTDKELMQNTGFWSALGKDIAATAVGAAGGAGGGYLVLKAKQWTDTDNASLSKLNKIQDEKKKEAKLRQFSYYSSVISQLGAVSGMALSRKMLDANTYHKEAGTFQCAGTKCLQVDNEGTPVGEKVYYDPETKKLIGWNLDKDGYYRRADGQWLSVTSDAEHLPLLAEHMGWEEKPLVIMDKVYFDPENGKGISWHKGEDGYYRRADGQWPSVTSDAEHLPLLAERMGWEEKSYLYDTKGYDTKGNAYRVGDSAGSFAELYYVDKYDNASAVKNLLLAVPRGLARVWPQFVGMAAEAVTKQALTESWTAGLPEHSADFTRASGYAGILSDSVGSAVSLFGGAFAQNHGLVYQKPLEKIWSNLELRKSFVNSAVEEYEDRIKKIDNLDGLTADDKQRLAEVVQRKSLDNYLEELAKDYKLTGKQRGALILATYKIKPSDQDKAEQDKILSSIPQEKKTKYQEELEKKSIALQSMYSVKNFENVKTYVKDNYETTTTIPSVFRKGMIKLESQDLARETQNLSLAGTLEALKDSGYNITKGDIIWTDAFRGWRNSLLTQTLAPVAGLELNLAVPDPYLTNMGTSALQGAAVWLGTKLAARDENKDIGSIITDEIKPAGLATSMVMSIGQSQLDAIKDYFSFGYLSYRQYTPLAWNNYVNSIRSRAAEEERGGSAAVWASAFKSGTQANLVSAVTASKTLSSVFGFRPLRMVDVSGWGALETPAFSEGPGPWYVLTSPTREMVKIRPWEYPGPLPQSRPSWIQTYGSKNDLRQMDQLTTETLSPTTR